MKSTTDIWFTTFLKMEGYEIVNYEVISKNRGVFYFNISNSAWKELKLKCDKSMICTIKTTQLAIKDLLY